LVATDRQLHAEESQGEPTSVRRTREAAAGATGRGSHSDRAYVSQADRTANVASARGPASRGVSDSPWPGAISRQRADEAAAVRALSLRGRPQGAGDPPRITRGCADGPGCRESHDRHAAIP